MIKRIEFKEKSFILVRRIIASISLASACICLYLLVSGFIPFWGRNMNAISAVNGVFEFINLGKRSSTYCLFCTTFGVLYILSGVKILISIITVLADIKKWLIAKTDNNDSRMATKKAVYYANSSLWWLFLIYIMSNLMYAFPLAGSSLLIVISLIVFNVLLNAAKNVLFKADIESSVIVAVNRGLMLASLVIFAFLSSNIQFSNISEGLSFLASDTSGNASQFFLQILIQQIVTPIFNLIVVFSMFLYNARINNNEFDGKTSARSMLIRNSVFLAIIVLGLAFANRYTNIINYFELIYKNIVFVLITALVYITSINQIELPTDVDLVTSEHTDNTLQSTENAE